MHSNERKIRILKIILYILIVFTICLLYCEYTINKITTQFSLIGKDNVIVEYGDEFVDEGFVAKYNKKNISDKVIVKSNVDDKKIGKYQVSYNLKFKYLAIDKTLIRNVSVVDTVKPDLTINSDKEIYIPLYNSYNLPEYSAVDNVDGNISDKVVVDSNLDTTKEGIYEINYSIIDSSNNETKDKIVIHVEPKYKNSHIDISISNQTLNYYEYGKLVLSSYIVTGINNGTPTGNFKVLNKARNVNLVGADYVSFVNYWIAFKGNNYGMHDASWRSSFGGTIYKYNGSHGCVNMPYYKVKELYNLVEIGTPVYIKY